LISDPGMNGNNSDESALIERAKTDSEAFGVLYERHFDRIYNYIYYRTGNIHDAEDLTAKVFFRAIQHIGNYQDRGGPFSAWLYSIARNLLENREALLAAIKRLPEDRQDLLILKYVNEESNAEIGRILGRSEGAIKSLYHRTLLSLKNDLIESSRRDQVRRQEEAVGDSGWTRFRSRIRRNRMSG